jgi:glycyl-tRNA synthetase
MVMDKEIDGICFQLNYLIKEHLKKIMADVMTTAEFRLECEDIVAKLDGMTKDEMGAVFRRFQIKSPINGNDLSDPIEYPLMFIVDKYKEAGMVWGYLRPELAQGIFVNFKQLLDSNQVIILPREFLNSRIIHQ